MAARAEGPLCTCQLAACVLMHTGDSGLEQCLLPLIYSIRTCISSPVCPAAAHHVQECMLRSCPTSCCPSPLLRHNPRCPAAPLPALPARWRPL